MFSIGFYVKGCLLALIVTIHVIFAEPGDYKGCFRDNPSSRQQIYKPNSANAVVSGDRCVEACAVALYMFAAVFEAKWCVCTPNYNLNGDAGNCTLACPAKASQSCGGPGASSVYETGVFFPGPPQNLTHLSSSENQIQVSWRPPMATNRGVYHYKVVAQLLFTYDTVKMVEPPKEWSFPNKTFIQSLSGLIAGSEYNISLRASSPFGESPPVFASYWTEIGTPTPPPEAIILKKDSSTMTIKLTQVKIKTGPTSGYQLIVVDESAVPAIFEPSNLYDSATAATKHIPYYIAAELTPQEANSPFVVGDGATYKTFVNIPLSDEKMWTVVVGVLSSKNGVTKASYSKPAVYHVMESQADSSGPAAPFAPPVHHGVIEMSNDNEEADVHSIHLPHGESHSSSALVTGLSVAIGIGAVLLVASIVVYFLMRKYYGRERRSLDHQELTTHHSPAPESSDNGIASSILYVNDDADLVDAYESLKERFWHIPRSYLEIGDSELGQGKFGSMYNGVAHRRNQQISVLIQTSPAQATLNDSDRRTLLNELEAMLRLGSHANVITFIGACEDKALLHLATEYYQVSLKDFLLESRALDHYPVYAERQHRFSTLREEQLLELMAGVARGLAHLSQNRIVHRHLTARHIAVVDGAIPKIAHFCLAEYEPVKEKYDYSRWTAAESLKSRVYTTKSDVWSFGIVLWEAVTCGGTPYHGVKSKDVALRVLRGMRLDQPKYLGDDLYQLMLQCWQIDLDERPTFHELTNILDGLTTEGASGGHLHFNLYPGFQYDKFDVEQEVVLLDST